MKLRKTKITQIKTNRGREASVAVCASGSPHGFKRQNKEKRKKITSKAKKKKAEIK